MLSDKEINTLNDKNFLKKCKNFVKETLKEDIGSGDITTLSTIPEEETGKAKLIIKDYGIIAGINLAKIFASEKNRLAITILKNDGDKVKKRRYSTHTKRKYS